MQKNISRGRRTSRVSVALALWFAAGLSSVASASQPGDALVERGRYLATAGNCATCHTREGGEPFAGGLPFTTPFGKLYSTNITSDPQTGIGGWTEAQFAQALREGVRPSGEHLYPAFPYTAYTKMTDEDVAALYAYMKTIAPVSAAPPENELGFPYNQRWALGLWKAMFFDNARFSADPAKSAEWNRGAYLIGGLAHCSACHSPRNFFGAERSSMAMTGGVYTDKVPTGQLRSWSAPNLTSAANGLQSWSLEDLFAYLKTGRNTFTETFGPMNEVIANSTRHLTDADVRAMAVYLKDLPPNEGAVGAAASEEVMQRGASLYDVHCGTCHLPTGEGSQDASAGARLVGSPVVQASDPASLINVILHSPERAELGLPKRWDGMPNFDEKLTDEEIAAIASYLRGTWGNQGGVVTEAQVAKQR